MRMHCWVSALLLLPAAVLADGDPGAGVQASAAGPGRTKLVFNAGRGPVLVVTRDSVVPAAARPEQAQLLGTLGDTVAIVADSYRSRLNQGSGQCGAGEERFLRVVRLVPRPAKETYRTKLASCWNDIELQTESGVQWSPASGELQIRWLLGPVPTLRLQIDADGSVKELKPA